MNNTEPNPYQTPDENVSTYGNYSVANSNSQIEIDGKHAYGRSPIVFPKACVCCGSNEEDGKVVTANLYYCSPWVYLLILVNLLVLAIVHLAIRKKAQVTYYLCPECTQRYKKRKKINISVWVLFVALIVLAIVMENGLIALPSMALFFVGLITAIFATYPIKTCGFSAYIFKLKGFSQDYVESINAHR